MVVTMRGLMHKRRWVTDTKTPAKRMTGLSCSLGVNLHHTALKNRWVAGMGDRCDRV